VTARMIRGIAPLAVTQSTVYVTMRNPVLVGYMRVSKADGSQAVELQRAALLEKYISATESLSAA
jgi:hypothetical protein